MQRARATLWLQSAGFSLRWLLSGRLLSGRLLLAVASLGQASLCGGARALGHAGFRSCSRRAQRLWLRALEHSLSSCGLSGRLLVAVASLGQASGCRGAQALGHAGFRSCSRRAQRLWLRALEHSHSSCGIMA